MVILISGCTTTTHTQFLKEHWTAHPTTISLNENNTHSAVLQIIITYDGPLSSHSALRLDPGNGEEVTFWDPAGAYGLVGHYTDQNGRRIHPYGRRQQDIIMSHIPDVPTYMRFRWFIGDSSVEIFEWDISKQHMEVLRDVLRNETDSTHPQGEFHTETTPAFCSMAISDFLQRFATPMIKLTSTYLWPHNLGEALLEQSPSRIRVFFPNQAEQKFLPPLPAFVGP